MTLKGRSGPDDMDLEVHPKSGGPGLEAKEGTEAVQGEELPSGLQASKGPPAAARDEAALGQRWAQGPPPSLAEGTCQPRPPAVVQKAVLKAQEDSTDMRGTERLEQERGQGGAGREGS